MVGASLAGWRAAEALRRQGFDGRLHLIGEESHLPYDRPPLSKQLLLGEQQPDDLRHTDQGTLDQLGIMFLARTRAIGLDRAGRRVRLAGGESVPYDALVIATGAAPIRPSFPWLDGMHTLRTLEDGLALREAFSCSPHVVIVGAGFVGLEVASAARRRGLEVTVVEPQAAPLTAAVGPLVGAAAAALARRDGVELILGRAVATVEGSRRVERVVLSDGRRVPADLVLVGVGVAPNVGWLEESGLADKRGVRCDESARTLADPRVYAAGDVACARRRGLAGHARVEHWTNAIEQGELVARNIVDPSSREALERPPYFWSDQFGTKIQMAGRYAQGARTEIVQGSLRSGNFVAVFTAQGETVGAVAFNEPRTFIRYRRHIAVLDRAMARAGTGATRSTAPVGHDQVTSSGRAQPDAARRSSRGEDRSAHHVSRPTITRARDER